MKVPCALAIACASLLAAPAVAAAAPPITIGPPGDVEIHVPAGESPCSVTLLFHDNSRTRVFLDSVGELRFVHVTGRVTGVVTSDDTGNSMDITIPGPVFVSPDDTAVLTGSMLLFGPNILALVNGRAVVPPSGIDDVVISGKRVDLCPILNP